MKITEVRTRVVEWRGKTVPPQPHFCTNPLDVMDLPADSMASYRFHGWLIVEIFTDAGHVGIGNAALSPPRSTPRPTSTGSAGCPLQDIFDFPRRLLRRLLAGPPTAAQHAASGKEGRAKLTAGGITYTRRPAAGRAQSNIRPVPSQCLDGVPDAVDRDHRKRELAEVLLAPHFLVNLLIKA